LPTQYDPRNTHHDVRNPITQYAIRYTTCEFFVQTNPICTNPEYALTSFSAKAYVKDARFSPAKANPNKPKQSQSDPHFSPVIAPQTQNEPKQTQFIAAQLMAKPDQTQFRKQKNAAVHKTPR
jgi:hypothetical protein